MGRRHFLGKASGALYISEYAVQEHLSNTFDKVGLLGRRALVKRLFFDNLYPESLGWYCAEAPKFAPAAIDLERS